LTTPGDPSCAQRGVIDTVSGIGERALIERIRRRLPPAPAWLVVGIGDDAAVAVVDRGALQVLTTDALVEGIHFDRRFSSPFDIGYKALAVNVSDVAAMGAAPRLALLSLMLPAALELDVVDGLMDGLTGLASQIGVALAGGNITRSPGPLVVDVTVAGAVMPRKVLTRGGGRPGDRLFLTGSIGAAAAGLDWLRMHDGQTASIDPALAACVERHRRPEPRARLGAILGRTRTASACMDLSDGLADAVRQLAEASGTGAIIEASRLPVHAGAAQWFAARGQDPLTASLSGGDDYELLFAVPKRSKGRMRLVERQARGVPITFIGELTGTGALELKRDGVSNPLPHGFVHF
jgi:thiamine-monophosphate kinase